ncbi:MAG: PAS domain S-box protein [Methylovulum sp.]|nr:PAS domain S-box protein [Methylovulum sp.]
MFSFLQRKKLSFEDVLVISFAMITAFLLFLSITLTYQLAQEIAYSSLEVNFAGRQRMLVERMTLLAVQIDSAEHLGLNKYALKQELNESKQVFSDTFNALQYGGKTTDSQGASVYLNPCQFVSGKAVLAQTNTVLLVYFKALKTFSDAETPHEQLAALQKIIEVVPRLRELTNLFTYQLQVNNESAMDGTRAYRNGLIALSIAILLFWAVIGRQHFQTLRKKYAQQTERMHMLDVCLTNANDSIIIVSVDNEEGTVSHPITYVNHAFEKQTGYSYEEVMGKTPDLWHGEKTDKATLTRIYNALTCSQPVCAELLMYSKAGQEFTNEINITPIANRAGEITHWLAVERDITERKEAEQRFMQLSRWHQTILNHVPALVGYWNAEQRNVFANQAYFEWFNIAPEALQDAHLSDLLCAECYQEFAPYIANTLAGQVQRFEHQLRCHHNQTLRSVMMEFIPELTADGVVGFYIFGFDISELKRAERHNKIYEDKLQKLFELTSLGIALLDLDGHYLDANRGFEKILGYSKTDLQHMQHKQLSAQSDTDISWQQLSWLVNNTTYQSFETIYLGKQGNDIAVFVNAVLISDLEGKSNIWLIIEDISQRKHAEQQLLQAKILAEEQTLAKADFLATMSHEIRTPMNAVIGLCALALNKTMLPEVRDYVQNIQRASDNLLLILNDILDFSKLEAGQYCIEEEPFNLDELLTHLRNLLVITTDNKGLFLHVEKSPSVPAELMGDAMRLQQILTNLLTNAIKFTATGGVTLSINSASLTASHAVLVFSVQDTGIGMSPTQQEKLFKAYSQVEVSTSRRYGGTGLGLAISDKLLNLMGGHFTVSSQPDVGSCFSFELRLAINTAASVSTTTSEAASNATSGGLQLSLQKSSVGLTGKHILVADDFDLNQQVLQEYLEMSGMTVDLANNGKEVLQWLSQNTYDAILMDVQMPEMSGLEATEHIRKEPRYANLPIIALTGGVTADEHARCVAAGMNSFVTKPIKVKELLAILTEYLA